ncbi:MAG: hypothetical protein MJZ75_02145 [Paludibacteraceae bacterium]|nr:hypothetical protein [Paludibacteraceae bacterium]
MKKFTKSLCVFAALLIGAVGMNVSANVNTLKNQDLSHIEDGVMIGTMNHSKIFFRGVNGEHGTTANEIKTSKAGSMFEPDVTVLDCGYAYEEYKDYTFTVIADKDVKVKVTKIAIAAKMYNAIAWHDCWVSLNGGTQVKVGSTSFNTEPGGYTTVTSNVTGNAADTVVIPMCAYRTHTPSSGTNSMLLIKSIVVTYQIIPNAPGMIGTEQTIDVTLDPENPQTLNVVPFFENKGSHYTLKYAASEGGELLNGTDFFAQKAGTYMVYSYVDELKDHSDDSKSCHEKSAYSNPLVVNVKRADPTLILKEDHLDTVEVSVDPVNNPIYFDIYDVIDEYVGDGLAYEIIAGDKTAGHIVDSAFFATALGEYTIRIKSVQGDQYNEAYRDIVVTAKKATPTFDILFDEKAMLVGDTVFNAFNVMSLDPMSVVLNLEMLEIDPINNGVDSVVKIDPISNTAIAVNAGKAHFTVVQSETSLVRAGFIEYYFTVSKHENKFIVIMDGDSTNMANMLWNDGIFVYITPSNADSAYSVVNGEGADEYATYYPEDNQIWAANEKNGLAKWYLHQDEDYKYLAAEDSMMVMVNEEENPCTIDEIEFAQDEMTVNTYGVQNIPNGGNGVAGTLTFNARKQAMEVSTTMTVWQQVDGAWSQVAEVTGLESNSKTYSVELDPNATAFTFDKGSSILTKFVKHVTLSRNTYLKPVQDTVILYDILRDSTVSGSFDLDYSTCDPYTIKLSSDNAHIALEDITTNASEAKVFNSVFTYTAGADQEFGMDTVDVVIKNASHEAKIVVLAEVVERTRLQLAQDTALALVDSLGAQLIGDTTKVPAEQLDSLQDILDEYKEKINDAESIEEVKELEEELKDKLDEFIDGIKEDDKEKIDDKVAEELVISEDPYQELPISDELKELIDQYKDSLDKTSSLDSLNEILNEALDSIHNLVEKEKQELMDARNEGKNDIDEKIADIKGHDELQDFVPAPWAEKLDELEKESKQNIDSCVTPKQVGDTVLYAQDKFDDLFEEFRQQAKDSVVSGMSAFEPLSEQLQEMLDTTLARLDTVGNIYDMLAILEENTYNVFAEVAKEQTEMEFNDDPFDNTEIFEKLAEEGAVRDVTLNMSFVAGEWTTICLPFSLPSLVGTPFENAEVVAMSTSMMNASEDTLLINVKPVSIMTAGQPYLIKVAKDTINPTFSQVAFGASEGDLNIAGAISFEGNLRPMDLSNAYNLTLGETNVLNYVADEAEGKYHMSSFHAFFMIDESVYADFIPVKIVRDVEHVGLKDVFEAIRVEKFIRHNRVVIRKNHIEYDINGAVLR